MATFQLIRTIAREKKIPLRRIAGEIGVTENHLHHQIQKGFMNTRLLESIAEVLGVSPGVFFGDSETPDEKKILIRELEKENRHLRELLAEKERTIKILMKK